MLDFLSSVSVLWSHLLFIKDVLIFLMCFFLAFIEMSCVPVVTTREHQVPLTLGSYRRLWAIVLVLVTESRDPARTANILNH